MKKNTNKNKDKFIGFRVTDIEHDCYKEKATMAGVSISTYARRQMDQEPIVLIAHPQELVHQLIAIGNNINQIAYRCNATNNLSSSDISKAVSEWQEARALLLDFLSGAQFMEVESLCLS